MLVTCLGVCLLYTSWAGHVFSFHFFFEYPDIWSSIIFISTCLIIYWRNNHRNNHKIHRNRHKLSIYTNFVLCIFFLKVHESKMFKSKPWIHRVTWLYHQLLNSKHSLSDLYCLNRIEMNIDNNGSLVCKINKLGGNYNTLNVCQEINFY